MEELSECNVLPDDIDLGYYEPSNRPDYERVVCLGYSMAKKKWITIEGERLRIILPPELLDKSFSYDSRQEMVLVQQHMNPNMIYREGSQLESLFAYYFPAFTQDTFEWCGCDQMECARNVMLSKAFCGYCLKR